MCYSQLRVLLSHPEHGVFCNAIESYLQVIADKCDKFQLYTGVNKLSLNSQQLSRRRRYEPNSLIWSRCYGFVIWSCNKHSFVHPTAAETAIHQLECVSVQCCNSVKKGIPEGSCISCKVSQSLFLYCHVIIKFQDLSVIYTFYMMLFLSWSAKRDTQQTE